MRNEHKSMKAITTLFVILLTGCVGSSVYAHSSAVPLVELTVSLTDDALTYEARIPTFAIEPLTGYDLAVGESLKTLPTSRDEIEAFFAEACPVKIDGIAVRPVLAELAICAPELPSSEYGQPPVEDYADAQNSGTSPGPPARWVEAKMKLVYSTKGTARQVAMAWNVFTADGADALGLLNPFGMDASGGPDTGGLTAGNPNEVIAVSELMGRRSFLTFTPEEPEYVWHADGRTRRADLMAVVPNAAEKTISLPTVPIAATVLLILFLAAARSGRMPRVLVAGATLMVLLVGIVGRDIGRVEITQFWRGGIEIPEEAEAKEIFAALHKNVYRAFDYETEDAIYDALAQSVSGGFLDEVYNDVYQGLILSEQGGAICKIESVEILESTMQPATEERGANPQFRMSCNWRVLGLVEHWGHAHRRINEYSAIYTLMPFDNDWKISGVEMTDQKRITGETE
jgi:hypothetical protein